MLAQLLLLLKEEALPVFVVVGEEDVHEVAVLVSGELVQVAEGVPDAVDEGAVGGAEAEGLAAEDGGLGSGGVEEGGDVAAEEVGDDQHGGVVVQLHGVACRQEVEGDA